MSSSALVKAQEELARFKSRSANARERAARSAKVMQRDAVAVVAAYGYGALKKDRWHGDDKIAVAQKVKAMMQASKKWKEKSEKKNPAKDDVYQDTLKVMAWLAGK